MSELRLAHPRSDLNGATSRRDRAVAPPASYAQEVGEQVRAPTDRCAPTARVSHRFEDWCRRSKRKPFALAHSGLQALFAIAMFVNKRRERACPDRCPDRSSGPDGLGHLIVTTRHRPPRLALNKQARQSRRRAVMYVAHSGSGSRQEGRRRQLCSSLQFIHSSVYDLRSTSCDALPSTTSLQALAQWTYHLVGASSRVMTLLASRSIDYWIS